MENKVGFNKPDDTSSYEYKSLYEHYCVLLEEIEKRDIADKVRDKCDAAEFAELREANKKLKEQVKWNLENNDEFGCEFLGITIVREENKKLREESVALKRDLEKKSKDIGRAEHRGNTVDYIYDKCKNYGNQITQLSEKLGVAIGFITDVSTKSKLDSHAPAYVLYSYEDMIVDAKGILTKLGVEK
jgi:hypothetical protein